MARDAVDDEEVIELPRLLTPTQVATWLGVSKKAVYHMVTRAEIPDACVVRIGTRLRFSASSLKQWLTEKRASLGQFQ